jgi:hypothetical protein
MTFHARQGGGNEQPGDRQPVGETHSDRDEGDRTQYRTSDKGLNKPLQRRSLLSCMFHCRTLSTPRWKQRAVMGGFKPVPPSGSVILPR